MPPRSLLAPFLRPLRPRTCLRTPRVAPRLLQQQRCVSDRPDIPAPGPNHRYGSVEQRYITDDGSRQPSEQSTVDKPTTFQDLDVFGSIPPPASSINIIYKDGFLFSNEVRIQDGSGAMLVHNEVFKWRPAERGSEIEKKAIKTGVLELGDVWGMLDVVHPKPELLIVGTGRKNLLLSKEDRNKITELGIRMDVMSTRNAAAQYNLLTVERPPGVVAAALLVEEFGSK